MKHIKLILLLITLIEFSGKAQNISFGIVNSKCNCEANHLDSILVKYKLVVMKSLNDYEIIENQGSGVKNKIDFLNGDFKTNVFSQACKLRSVDFTINENNHLGVLDMGLESNDLSKCLEAIKSSHRQNFETKVLTKFKIIERKNELIIIYTETPFDRLTQDFFSQIN